MFDPLEDFAAVTDNLEAVTLLRRGTGASVAIAHALRRAVTAGEATIVNQGDVRKNVASGGRCTAADLVWHLPVAELDESPRLGDVILDGDAQRWTILAVKRTTVDTRWRCETRNVSVAYGLDDTITVQKSGTVSGVTTWRTWRTGIRARIQPTQTTIDAAADTPSTTIGYRIFVEEDLELDHTYRICGADGTVYTITGATGAERIGELQVIAAEVITY